MPAPRAHNLPVVALVGRTNVGKSTLWNKLTESGRAIVSPEEHTTRDRSYAPVIWRGLSIMLADTGGMDAPENDIGAGIVAQSAQGIREADLVLFVIDSRSGVMPQDREIAKQIRGLHKHILVVANKADALAHLGDANSPEVWQLGLGEAVPVSATTGRGTGDLLDRVYAELEKIGRTPSPADLQAGLKLVVMGRPNVGKSSLVNAILKEERLIVTPTAHTTREPIDTQLTWNDEPVTLVDTAGLRRETRASTDVDEESLERNRQALNRADIAFLVLDASQPPSQGDKQLAGLMKDATKGLVIVVNKWDLVSDKTTNLVNDYEQKIRRSFPFLDWAPIIFISALKHQRTDAMMDLAFKVREERRRQISYNALQRLLKTVVARKKPLPESGAFSPYVHDVEQIGIEPPTFHITVRGTRASVHPNWIRYFENRLREKFGFQGTPLVVKVQILPIQKISERSPEAQQKVTDSKKKKNPWRRKRPIGRKGMRY